MGMAGVTYGLYGLLTYLLSPPDPPSVPCSFFPYWASVKVCVIPNNDV